MLCALCRFKSLLAFDVTKHARLSTGSGGPPPHVVQALSLSAWVISQRESDLHAVLRGSGELPKAYAR